MSKSKKAKSDGWLQLLRDRMMLFFPLFLFALVALNCFVAYRAFHLHDVERSSFARSVAGFRSEVSYLKSSYESHITNLLHSVDLLRSSSVEPSTNSAPVASASSPSAPSSVSVPVSFHFYSHGGFPFFRYFGSDYSVGSDTSYGRVVRVFPDRVFFDTGYVFVNNYNPDDFSSVRSAPAVSLPQPERISLDD